MKPHVPPALEIITMTVYGWTAAFFLMDLWPKSDNTTVVMLRVWPNMFLAAVVWEVSAWIAGVILGRDVGETQGEAK